MSNEVRTGMVLEDVEVEGLNENVWTVLNAKLENPVEFDEKPTVKDLQDAKLEYGYSKCKMAVSDERKLIVLSPVEISGHSL